MKQEGRIKREGPICPGALKCDYRAPAGTGQEGRVVENDSISRGVVKF